MAPGAGIAIFIYTALIVLSAASAGATTLIVQTSAAEIEFWRSVESSKDPLEFEAYLRAYPNGQFAPLATIRLNKLRDAASERKAAVPPVAPAAHAPTRAPGRAAIQVDIPPPPPAKARGWIGAQIRNVDDKRARELNLAGPSGAEVEAVVGFGPAASSGLRPNDVILSIDGKPVLDGGHLIRLISAIAPTESTDARILRGGQRLTLKFTVGHYFNDQWAAAHRNDVTAMINLGSLYADGGLVDKNLAEAKRWFERAANGGSAPAMRALAERYEAGRGFEQNDGEAYRWYERAVAAGDSQSMFALGLFYYRGRGVERDPRKAAELYDRAAALGHPGAMQNYALALQNGDGATKNMALALEYFHRAAKLGQPEAFAALALAHYEGHGTRKDLPEALRWFREAAQRGHSEGYLGIGTMYERGEGGLKKDRGEAIKNYRKAAELNHSSALARLKALKATPHDGSPKFKTLIASAP